MSREDPWDRASLDFKVRTRTLLELSGFGPGRWLLPIVGIAAFVGGIALYVWSLFDFRRWRRYGESI